MVWSIFASTAIPAGAILAAMLASGHTMAMSLASKVLSTPVRVGNWRLSLAVVMTAFCLVLSLVSLSGVRRHETRVNEAQGAFAHAMEHLQDRHMMEVFHWSRNYYLSLLGLALWLAAWRLKVLHDGKRIVSHHHLKPGGSWITRICYIAVGVVAFLAADVPLCRINYNLQLATFVTPRKTRLLNSVGACESAMLTEASQLEGSPCALFCAEVKELSRERLLTIKWARNWHIFGRLAAELFDETRGVQQGEDRIGQLFAKKTCLQVLRSVDKSNGFVNAMCAVFTGVAIIGAFAAWSSACSTVEGAVDSAGVAAGIPAKSPAAAPSNEVPAATPAKAAAASKPTKGE